PEVVARLVRLIHGLGLTALQAKRRLTDLTPEIVVPQLPPPAAGPREADQRYTPTVIDAAAADEDDEETGEPAPAGADAAGAGEEPADAVPAPRSEEPPAPSDAPPGGRRSTTVRAAVPLQIAERIRAFYAREARF
ncbi:hypothetical protein ACFWZM_10025, partial [[Kitasatospora] papulosa]